MRSAKADTSKHTCKHHIHANGYTWRVCCYFVKEILRLKTIKCFSNVLKEWSLRGMNTLTQSTRKDLKCHVFWIRLASSGNYFSPVNHINIETQKEQNALSNQKGPENINYSIVKHVNESCSSRNELILRRRKLFPLRVAINEDKHILS